MYIVDTNFLGTLAATYPDDLFPTLWKKLETPLFANDVFFHDEVHTEMKKWKHPRLNWYEHHVQGGQILMPDEKEVEVYAEVTNWVTTERMPKYKPHAVDDFLNAADSWLVSSAHRHRAKLVTNEISAPGGIKKVKIPDVAEQFEVECLTAIDFLRKLSIVI